MLDVLLELADGKRHGWSLIRDMQQRDGGDRILPTNFYRTLRALRDDGLIEEAKGDANEDRAERRQYFSLTLARREGRARGSEAPRGARRRSASAEAAESALTMKASRSLYRLLLRLCPPDLRTEFGDEMEALFLQSLQRARGAGEGGRVGAAPWPT